MQTIKFLVILLCIFSASIASAAEQREALRVRFGMKDTEATDWSGSLDLKSGQVESIRGWRWMPGDHAQGNAWTVSTRRAPVQTLSLIHISEPTRPY